MSLLGVSLIVVTIHIAASIKALVLYSQDFNDYEANILAIYPYQSAPSAFYGVTWGLLVIDLGICIFVTQLLVFHFYLISTNQTTF
jgi:hypothetical protein